MVCMKTRAGEKMKSLPDMVIMTKEMPTDKIIMTKEMPTDKIIMTKEMPAYTVMMKEYMVVEKTQTRRPR